MRREYEATDNWNFLILLKFALTIYILKNNNHEDVIMTLVLSLFLLEEGTKTEAPFQEKQRKSLFSWGSIW